MDLLFSVIIPVYNAEKTLRRCVDSVLAQERNDVEILLVNDGSKDGSPEICWEYRDLHDCVRVVDKENGGVSSARNAGLDAAHGRYAVFVDSDDYLAPGALSAAEELLRQEDWDLIRFSHGIDDGADLRSAIAAPRSMRSRAEAMPKIIDDICTKDLNAPWAKIYKRSVLEAHGIRFPLGVSIAEDRAFNIRYSMYIQNYLISDRMFYYVNIENEQSLSRKKHPDLTEQFRIADRYTENAIQEADIPEAEKELYRRAVHFGTCRSVYKKAKDLRREGVGWFGRQKALWRRCREINRRRLRYPSTRYCRLITLPVRLYQTWAIDWIAGRLVGR